MRFKVAPLPGTFMITSIVGFLVSAIWVLPRTPSYGFAFCLVFALMFIASIISMTYADVDEILYLERTGKPRKTKKRAKKRKKK